MDAGCPDGADGVGVRWRKLGAPDWTDGDDLACSGEESLGGCDLADNYEVQTRWLLGGNPVSDWSSSNIVACS